MDSSERIGDRIRTLRNNADYSQQKLADKLESHGCDISRSTLANIESGEREVRVSELKAIARALGTDTETLVDEGGDADVETTVEALVDDYLDEAVKNDYSDLFFTPTRHGIEIRARSDNTIKKLGSYYDPGLMIDALKKKADENGLGDSSHRLPQESPLFYNNTKMRLNLLPNRLEDRVVQSATLRVLGIDEISPLSNYAHYVGDQLGQVRRLLHRPSGVLAISGPDEANDQLVGALLNEIADKQPRRSVGTAGMDGYQDQLADGIQQYCGGGDGMFSQKVTPAQHNMAVDVYDYGPVDDSSDYAEAFKAARNGMLVIIRVPAMNAQGALNAMKHHRTDEVLENELVGVVAQHVLSALCRECRIDARDMVRATDGSDDSFAHARDYGVAAFKQGEGCSDCSNGYTGPHRVMEILPNTSPDSLNWPGAVRQNDECSMFRSKLQGSFYLPAVYPAADLALHGEIGWHDFVSRFGPCILRGETEKAFRDEVCGGPIVTPDGTKLKKLVVNY